MGWLFAVALGMQERSARGVWRAMLPIALGHALAIGSGVLLAALAELVGLQSTFQDSRWVDAARDRSVLPLPTAASAVRGMQVGFRDLTIWSFLMASAHGAGFMVLPLVTDTSANLHAATAGHAHAATGAAGWPLSIALGPHTLTYLAVTALIAWIVDPPIGLAILRTA